jgi:hypothetical protein
MGIGSKIKEAVKNVADKLNTNQYKYSMKTKDDREYQVRSDYEKAKTSRTSTEKKWIEIENYYRNEHDSKAKVGIAMAERGVDYIPPVLPDPFITVESQIDATVPAFEFAGRDEQLDPDKAKEREKIVEYICYTNNLEKMNLENERELHKFGDAWFKVAYNGSTRVAPGVVGEIEIGNPHNKNVFIDPSCKGDIDRAEYIIYSYPLHIRAALREWGKIVKNLQPDGFSGDTEIFDDMDIDDETVQIIEYFYRDMEGDIACSIMINFKEVRHIKKFWEKTRESGNTMYPFAHYCLIPSATSFWNIGDIEVIKDLVDAADEEFATALLNDKFMANDIIIQEEGALAKGQEITGIPGQVVKATDGRAGGIKRLGGVSQNGNLFNMLDFIHEKVMETTGNFAVKGSEPERVTTASGLAQVREDRESRSVIKKADRKSGYQRLFQLVDWMALEFYDENRNVLVRGEDGKIEGSFTYNSDNFRNLDPYATDDMTDPKYYYPKVDVRITAGDAIQHSKAFTLAVTQELMGVVPTPANLELIFSVVDMLDLPNKKLIKDSMSMAVQMQMQQQAMAEQQQAQMTNAKMAGAAGDDELLPTNIQKELAATDMSDQEIASFLDIYKNLDGQTKQSFIDMSKDERQSAIQKLLQG